MSRVSHISIETGPFDRPANAHEILQVEGLLGCRLPRKYSEFLSVLGGGYPHPCAFEDEDGRGWILRRFFGIDDILADLNDEPYLPAGWLVFGGDEMGSHFVFDTDGHVYVRSIDDDYRLIPVANTFESLLGQLAPTFGIFGATEDELELGVLDHTQLHIFRLGEGAGAATALAAPGSSVEDPEVHAPTAADRWSSVDDGEDG